MLRIHFLALVLSFVLLVVAVIAGNQLFGDPIESAPTIPVEQHTAPAQAEMPVLSLA